MRLFLLCVALAIISLSEGTNYPTNLACTAVNSTVLSVTWSQATDVSVAGYHLDAERVDGLKIEYGLPSIELSSISYDSYTLYGLGKYAEYNVTVHSYFTSGGNGTDYVITCRTSSDIPDASNFNFSCEGISYSAITCSWDTLDTVYWNGIPQGYQLKHIGFVNDYYEEVNLTTSNLTYTITGLNFDTWYIIHLRTINDAGMSPLTSDHAKTLGFPVTVENKTRYYCYETIPGTMVWEWEEMPCTVYVGIIMVFMILTLIFMTICCLMCCCKGKSESKTNLAVNIFNEQGDDDERDLYDDDDDDDDDYDEPEEDYNEGEEEDYDSEGNPTETAKAAKKKRKLAEAHEGEAGGTDTEEEESEEEPEYETSEVETAPEEEYESSEEDEDLDEEDRAAKREKKLAAIAAAKELREKRREEKTKRKAEKDAESAKLKAEKDEEKSRRKAQKAEEKAKHKAEREGLAKQKADQDKKKKAENKKKKSEETERKMNAENDNKEESDYDSEDYESEDYDSDEYSDNENITEEKEASAKSEDKIETKKMKSPKKQVVGNAVLSTINEKRSTKKSEQRAKKINTFKNKKSNDSTGSKNTEKMNKMSNAPTNNKDTEKSTESKQGKQKGKTVQNNNQKEHRSRKLDADSDQSCTESDAEYYEDWDQDAENSTDTNATINNVNSKTDSFEKSKAVGNKSNVNGKKNNSKSTKLQVKNTIDAKPISKSKTSNSNQANKNAAAGGSPLQDDEGSEESDGYDSDDEDYDSDENEYSSEESEENNYKAKRATNTKTKVINKTINLKGANNSSDDSGRGSSMSCDWGDGNKTQDKGISKSGYKSNDQAKKTGFFGSLFGQSSKPSTDNQKPKQAMNKPGFGFSAKDKMNKSEGFGDWESDDDYVNENDIPTSINNKQQEQSTTNRSLAESNVKNKNYFQNGSTGIYSSNKGMHTDNTKRNSSIFSGNVTTDFGDWGSDNDDTNANYNHTKQNNYSSSGYGSNLPAKNTISVKGFGNNGNKFAANNDLNRYGQHEATGIYSNSKVQNYASKENGNFGAITSGANQNGNLVSNSYGLDPNGDYSAIKNVSNQDGHTGIWIQDIQFPGVNQTSNGNGQSGDPYSTMHIKGQPSSVNKDMHQKGHVDAISNDWDQNGNFSATSGNIHGNGKFSSNNNAAYQNKQGSLINNNSNTNPPFDSTNNSSLQNVPFGLMNDLSVHKRSFRASNNGQDNGRTEILQTGPNGNAWPTKNISNRFHTQGSVPEDDYQSENQISSQTYGPGSIGIRGGGSNNPYNAIGSNNNPYNAAGNSTNSYNAAGGSNNPYNASGGTNNPDNAAGGSYNPDNAAGASYNPHNVAGGRNNPYNAAGGSNNSSFMATYDKNTFGNVQHGIANQNKSRKLVSFRTNAASPPDGIAYNHDNLPAKAGQQEWNSGGGSVASPGKNGASGFDPSRNNALIMPDADIVLPEAESNKTPRSPVGKFIANRPAWNKTKSDDPNSQKRKGSKTPVEDLLQQNKRIPLTEPEPVFETDRLAKKFPFLNVMDSSNNKGNADKGNNANPGDSANPDGMRKNQSDSNLLMFFGKGKQLKNSHSSNDIQSIPNVPTSNSDGKSDAALNQPTRDKIFYGFGVGKWRLAAAKWLNTWKMRRRPVKTAKSSWD